MVIVAFRETNDKLVSLCTETFKNVKDAKAYIEADAKFYCRKHNIAKPGQWKWPDAEDYFSVSIPGTKHEAIWQYFQDIR